MSATDTEVRLDKVLVIIPTYNEVENVETIVARTRRANPNVDVLVADDNSPDGTGEIADRIASADDHVHVNHRKRNNYKKTTNLAGFLWRHDHG